MKIRLHQFVSRSGRFSSKFEGLEAISAGHISINGRITSKKDFQFDPSKSEVKYKDEILKMHDDKIYILMNKPKGYLSTKLTEKDIELGKKSIFSLIEEAPDKINSMFAVGRLDEDSSGLLIITNDGNLGHRLTHPQYSVEKVYEADVEDSLDEDKLKTARKGVTIIAEGKKYKTQPCKISRISDLKYLIIISEGKKREVKQIFHSMGTKVTDLKRVSIGKLSLDTFGIPYGSYRKVEGSTFDILPRLN